MAQQEYDVLSGSKDTIPSSVSRTGTVDSLGVRVSGTGTDFQGELEKGDYIYDAAQNEVREIIQIDQSTQYLQIDRAFSSDLSGVSLVHIPKESVNMREISVANDGAANATVNGATLVVGNAITFDQNDADSRGQHGYARPLVVDATGTSVSYLIRK